MYRYEDLKPKLFTEEGSVLFIRIRDQVQKLLAEAGAVRLDKAIRGFSGDSWMMLACIDRLVELEELYEVSRERVATQNRVFVGKS